MKARQNRATYFPPPVEFKLVAMRECAPAPVRCLTPKQAHAYWKASVETHPYFNRDAECLVVLLLDARNCVKGHHIVSTGTLDTCLSHPREVFRAAIVGAAACIVVMHNHPSGDPTPSEGDIKITRQLIHAADWIGIQLADHVIVGSRSRVRQKPYCSLRELGYFYK